MARIYVGTYAKYNAGSIKGAWLDLDDYADRDAFMEAAKALHADESDPELMFQDFEGFPRAYYGESHIKPELWAWLELDESDCEIVEAYHAGVEEDADIDRAREAYMGTAENESDWAYEYLNDTGLLGDIPEWARNYFDFEAYARDARLGGDVVFVRHNGELFVFSNH